MYGVIFTSRGQTKIEETRAESTDIEIKRQDMEK